MKKIAHYFALVKFSHTLFALPFALVGFAMATKAGGTFSPQLLLYVLLCMVFARNAAMGFNRYLDRHIDGLNPRTQVREIPAGKVSPRAAWWFVVLNALAFVATTYFINSLVLMLAPVALAVVLGYSYTKRFTPLCHLVLGLGLSLAPIGAYLAVAGQFAVLPLWLSVVVLLWVSGFDIIYALQDEEFDRQHRLRSIPTLLGKHRALLVSRALHATTAAVLLSVAYFYPLGWLFGLGAALFVALLVYQHSLVRADDLRRVNLAFFTTNGVASVLFALLGIASLYWFA